MGGTIFGVWRFSDRGTVAAECRRMGTTMAGYGAQRVYQSDLGEISIGKNVVPLLPEDQFETNPLRSEDGRFAMVADVRLDDRTTLVNQLGLDGTASHMSDSEVLFRAFLKDGMRVCETLIGEFAFAVWDQQERVLSLGRDMTGSRPMFFHINRHDGVIAFASLPNGLHALPDIPKRPNFEEFEFSMATWTNRDWHSYFDGVQQVPGRHFIEIDFEEERRTKYWDPDLSLLQLSKHEDYADAVEDCLNKAMTAALRGQSDVASAISAGYDSSYMALAAAKALDGKGRVQAYTSAPRESYTDASLRKMPDESGIAAELAALRGNIDHHIVRPNGEAYLDAIAGMTEGLQSPAIQVINGRWFDLIVRDVSQRGLNVLLDGFMGNLVFSDAGHLVLYEHLWAGRYGKMTFEAMRRLVAGDLGPRLFARSLRDHFLLGRNKDQETYLDRSAFSLAKKDVIARHRTQQLKQQKTHQANLLANFNQLNFGNAHKYHWQKYQIEVRDPFRDRRMIELALRLPPQQFRHKGQPRALAHTLLSRHVPRNLLRRMGRGLQSADWHEQFVKEKDRMIEEYDRMAEIPGLADVMDISRLRSGLDKIPSSGWNSPAVAGFYRGTLYYGLYVASFVRQVTGSNQ